MEASEVKVLMTAESETDLDLEVLKLFSSPEVKLIITQPQMTWPPVRGVSLEYLMHGGLMSGEEL